MLSESFYYGGYCYLLEKDAQGQFSVFQHKAGGLISLKGQLAYRIVRAYKRKVEKLPSHPKPRIFARKVKRRKVKP